MNHNARRSLAAAASAAALVLAVAGCASSAPSPAASSDEPVTLRVSAQQAISAEPLYVGIEEGFFADEGIEIEITDVTDFSASFAALQSGSLDIAFAPTVPILQAVRNNLPLKIVSPADGVNPRALEVPEDEIRQYTAVGLYTSLASGITDKSGLEGATIAVPGGSTQTSSTIIAVLEDEGVDTSGVEWVSLDYVAGLEALLADTVDAAVLISPFTVEADEANLPRVMNPSVEFNRSGTTSAWVTSTSLAEANAEKIERFQRALARSAEYANENLDLVKESVIERAGLDQTPDELPNSYFPVAVSVEDMQRIDDRLVEVGFFESELDVAAYVLPQP